MPQPPPPVALKSYEEIQMEAERLRQLRLQNQKMEQQLKNPAQNASVVTLKAVYACGMMDGILQEATLLSNSEATSKLREALKATDCDQIRKSAGIDSPSGLDVK